MPFEAEMRLPEYECHKHVFALKIKAINMLFPGQGASIVPAEEGYASLLVTQEYLDRFKPEVGGYFVVYADGYKSFSPAKAFEEGYVRV